MKLQDVKPQQIIVFEGKVKQWIFLQFNQRTQRYKLVWKDDNNTVIYVKNGTTEVTLIS